MYFIDFVTAPPSDNLLYMGVYDPVLVGLSVTVAILASYAALLVSHQMASTTSVRARHVWNAAGGMCLGLGIWAMHFVGMLAFSLPCVSSYDAMDTLLSTVPGILASTLAIKIISHRVLSLRRLAVGGLLIGCGIGTMHYAGMAAIHLNGLIRYDVRLFSLSLFVAVILATLALWIKFRLQFLPERWNKWATIACATVMGLAVSGMHYTAMAAAYFIRDDAAITPPVGMAPAFLASIILVATCLLVVVTIVGSVSSKPSLLSLARSYKLIALLIVGWTGISWLAADSYYERLGSTLYIQEFQRASQQAEQTAANINNSIELLKGIAQLVSHDEGVRDVLRRFGAHASPSTVDYVQRRKHWTEDQRMGRYNRAMQIVATQLKADVVYIVNAAGDCVVASNAATPASFVGSNYASRDYFQQIRAGQLGHQYALGRTSKIPGLYYGAPVFDNGHVIGAVIVKRDIDKFAALMNASNAFVSDVNGVIILSADKSLEFRALPQSHISRMTADQRMLQYGRNTFDAVRLTPWDVKRYPAAVHSGTQSDPFVWVAKTLPEDGITIHALHALGQLERFDVERHWLFFLLCVAGYLLSTAALAVVFYLRTSLRTEADLRVAATAFEAQQAMIITDAATVILRVNRAFVETTGYTSAEAVGHTPQLLHSGRHDGAFYAAMWESIRRVNSWQGEIWNRRKNGEIYPQWLCITAVKGSADVVTHYVGTMDDISQRKAAELKINHLAFYDFVTQLPNRRLLTDRLLEARSTGALSGRRGALLFIDLDDFKTLNDTLGHDKGDLLLMHVAQRLRDCVRDCDTVARFGGDEFTVLLDELGNNPAEAASYATAMGTQILDRLSRPYQLGELKYHSTCSIGITLFCGQTESVDDLLKQADLAMYQAKEAGRNTLRFFDQAMQAVVTSRSLLEADLRQSLEQKDFVLYYQPQVDSHGAMMGAEALVRWQHPLRGLVSPGDFIPLAEETGLILVLGQWVLETACAQLLAWSKDPTTAHLTLSVNISARQFRQPDFSHSVLAVINQAQVSPQKLKLELTESLLLNDLGDVVAKMDTLKSHGVSFSLDDFGTGYSSLSYLKRLPLDQLKIDQSFVRDILSDPNDAAIARTIVALGNSLGLSVIAEGVETVEQKNILIAIGCRTFQGYLFGRPMPHTAFAEYAARPAQATP